MMKAGLYKLIRLSAVMLVSFMFLSTLSQPAHAAAAPLDIDTCAPGFQDWDYTQKIVVCVSAALVSASKQVSGALASYILTTAYAIMSLSLAWYGVKILGGERQLVQKGVSLAIRWGVVILYLANATVFIDIWMSILVWFLNLLNAGYSPWAQLDELIGKLIGVGPSLVLAQGLIGILGATLISSTTGIFMFMAGFMGLLDLLLFIFNVVFTYLMAIALIAFLFAISPLLVPTLIFFYTERYFNKWWHIMVSATLIPMLMVTLLYFFLQIFYNLIADVFDVLGFPCATPTNLSSCDPPDYRAYQKMNQPKFAWVMPADPHLSQEQQAIAKSTDLSIPAVQSNVNPLLRRGFDKNNMNHPAIDFGPNHVKILEELMFKFVALWLFASIMKSVIRKIPNIADDIAGALNRISVEPTNIEGVIRRNMRMNQKQMEASAANMSQNVKNTVDRARNLVSMGSRGRKSS